MALKITTVAQDRTCVAADVRRLQGDQTTTDPRSSTGTSNRLHNSLTTFSPVQFERWSGLFLNPFQLIYDDKQVFDTLTIKDSERIDSPAHVFPLSDETTVSRGFHFHWKWFKQEENLSTLNATTF